MFNMPALILALVVATLYAAVFHLLLGKTWKQLLITWLAAVVGIGVGQALTVLLGWNDPLLGELHVVTASAVGWLCMFLARRLRI